MLHSFFTEPRQNMKKHVPAQPLPPNTLFHCIHHTLYQDDLDTTHPPNQPIY